MTTVAEALRAAAEKLAATSATARLDAELLMAHALGVARSEMLLTRMREPAPQGFDALVARRLSREPVAYILGSQEFYGRTFAVGAGVLIPRADSETTVAAALDACPAPRRVLDCGVGSGALLLTVLAERPGGAGVGIDRSPRAVAVASENAVTLALGNDWAIQEADWTCDGWADGLGKFDLIIANPPYVEGEAVLEPEVAEHEPAAALFAGPEGLDDYRVLIPQLPALLDPGGVAVLEIGHRQAGAVTAIAGLAGFTCELRRDLADRPRALILRRG